MINFSDFVLGLKVKLLTKLLDTNFHHPWKNIIINQLRFPEHPIISLEAGAVKSNRSFCKDLVNCFMNWKQLVAGCRNKTANFCIWGGGIPGNSSLLWNNFLISKTILYASDFIDNQGQILSYNNFRYKFNIRVDSLTKTESAHILLALRNFHSNVDPLKSVKNIDIDISLSILLADDKITVTMPESKRIREMIAVKPDMNILSIPQFVKWSSDIEELNNEQTWNLTLTNLIKLSNHYKLIQHQYKIFTKLQ